MRRCEDVIMTTTALARAQAGDGEAFRELTDPYRRELQLHCYRILGSVQDAEDMLQETLLAAWRGLGQFEERASMRSWLPSSAPGRGQALEGADGLAVNCNPNCNPRRLRWRPLCLVPSGAQAPPPRGRSAQRWLSSRWISRLMSVSVIGCRQ
jgi:hypothetical protein